MDLNVISWLGIGMDWRTNLGCEGHKLTILANLLSLYPRLSRLDSLFTSYQYCHELYHSVCIRDQVEGWGWLRMGDLDTRLWLWLKGALSSGYLTETGYWKGLMAKPVSRVSCAGVEVGGLKDWQWDALRWEKWKGWWWGGSHTKCNEKVKIKIFYSKQVKSAITPH